MYEFKGEKKRRNLHMYCPPLSPTHVTDTFSHDVYKTFRPSDASFKNVTSLTENNATHKAKVWRVCSSVVLVSLCNASVCVDVLIPVAELHWKNSGYNPLISWGFGKFRQNIGLATHHHTDKIFVNFVARLKQKAWYLDTCGFIPKKIQWHIHAGLWSLVNCWWEWLMLPYIGCSWILMTVAVGLKDGLGLEGDRCICMIPRHPPFSMKEEALPACKETIARNIQWSLRDRVMQQIWMYYKEKLTKNLADLNTFETSMSLRDHITT